LLPDRAGPYSGSCEHLIPGELLSALARMIDSALAGGAGLTRLPSGHGPDGYR
jgi:hypothetical protein